MDVARPISSVIPGLPGRVLGVLGRTTAPLTGRGITDALVPAASQAGVAKVLDNLVHHGIVLRTNAGPAAQYTLNREHLAAPHIEALAELRGTFLDRLRAALADLRPPPLSAYLFGSAARGDGSVDSDVDIALILPEEMPALEAWDAATAELRRRVHAMTGNDVSVFESRPRDLFRGEDGWLFDVLRHEGLRLAGDSVEDLARRWHALDAGTQALLERARWLVDVDEPEAAFAEFRVAVDTYRLLGDPYSEAMALGDLANAFRQVGRTDEAAATAEDAAGLLRALGDPWHEASVLALAAHSHADAGRQRAAVELFDRALGTGAAVASPQWVASLRFHLSVALLELGELDRAREECEQAVTTFRGVDAEREASALLHLADVVVMTDAAAAAEAAARARELFDGLGDVQRRGCALLRLGMARSRQGRHDESITFFRDALAHFEEARDRLLVGDALMFLGMSSVAVGSVDDGVALLSRAVEEFRALGQSSDLARALERLGSVLAGAGRHEEALRAYRAALDTFREVGDDRRARSALRDLERIFAREREAAS